MSASFAAPEFDLRVKTGLLFLHLPKTAGSSLKTLLLNELEPGLVCPAYDTLSLAQAIAASAKTATDDCRPLEQEDTPASAWRYFLGHFYAAAADRLTPKGIPTFVLLREPLARALSHYQQIMRGEFVDDAPFAAAERAVIEQLSLDAFLARTDLALHGSIVNLQTRYLGAELAFQRPEELPAAREAEYRRPDDNGLPAARRRLEAAAFIGLTERFADSLRLLAFTLGRRPWRTAPHVKVTPDPLRLTALSVRAQQRLEELNSLDLSLYAHAQALFERRYAAMLEALLGRYVQGNLARRAALDRSSSEVLPGRDAVLPDEVDDLLERHYEARRAIRAPFRGLVIPATAEPEATAAGMSTVWEGPKSAATTSLADFGYVRPEGTVNLYPVEHHPKLGAYCWTGPDTITELDMQRPRGERLCLDVQVLFAASPAALDGLRLELDDQPLVYVRSDRQHPRPGKPISLVAFSPNTRPDASSPTFVRLRLIAGETCQPPGEQRRLGVAIGRIRLTADPQSRDNLAQPCAEPAAPEPPVPAGALTEAQPPEVEPGADRPIVFFHLPKTAGISLRTLLESMWAPARVWHKYPAGRFPTPAEIAELRQRRYFVGHFYWYEMAALFTDGFLGLTMLREPIARAVSQFHHIQRVGLPALLSVAGQPPRALAELSLDDFLAAKPHGLHVNFYNWQAYLLGDGWPGIGLDELEARHVRSIARRAPVDQTSVKQHLIEMPFVGLTERFAESLQLLSFTFGWRPFQLVPRLNAAPKPHAPLSNFARQQLEAWNQEDMALYAFAQELFSRRRAAMHETLLSRYAGPALAQRISHGGQLEDAEIIDLLERHYEARRNARSASAAPQVTEVDFGRTHPEGLTNFHMVEAHPQYGAFRWTGPGETAEFDMLRPAGERLRLEFNVLNAISEAAGRSLTVKADGRPIRLADLSFAGEARRLVGFVTSHVDQPSMPFVRLQFTVGETRSPNLDGRTLGVALGKITLRSDTTPLPDRRPIADSVSRAPAPFTGDTVTPWSASQGSSAPEVNLTPNSRVVFFHLPKAAGTTLRALLTRQFSHEAVWPESLYYAGYQRQVDLDEASPYRFFAGHLYYTAIARLFAGGFVGLTQLRDPITRAISYFGQFQRNQQQDHATRSKTDGSPILVDLATMIESGHQALRNQQARLLGAELWFNSSRELPEAELRERFMVQPVDLELAKRRLQGMAVVGLAERLPETLHLLSFTFGWRPFQDVPQLNVTPNPAPDLAPAWRARLEMYNEQDLALYAFAQALFETRYAAMRETLLSRYAGPELARRTARTADLQEADLHALLERHYLARRDARNPTQRVQMVEVNFSRDCPEGTANLYAPETHPQAGAFRWTGPGEIAELDLPRPPGDRLRIEIKVLNSISAAALDGLRMTLDGQPVVFVRKRLAKAPATLPISLVAFASIPSTAGNFVRLGLTTGKTYRPEQDPRPLGLALAEIRLETDTLPPLQTPTVAGVGISALPSPPIAPEVEPAPGQKVVFFHLPKTAGTSLRLLVESAWTPGSVWPGIYLKSGPGPQKAIQRYRYFMGHFNWSVMEALLPTGFIGLTMLREPIARAISQFQQLQRTHPPGDFFTTSASPRPIAELTLDEFLAAEPHFRHADVRDLQARLLGTPYPDLSLDQRADYILRHLILFGPADLTLATQRLARMPFVGLTERFAESLQLLCFTFGWRPFRTVPHLNTSPRPSAPLSAFARVRLEEWNRQDAQVYAFAQALFEVRYAAMRETLLRRYAGPALVRTALRYGRTAATDLTDLLERHYLTRRDARCTGPRTQITELDFGRDSAEGAVNLYAVERHPQWGAYRWTGPGETAELDLPRPIGERIHLQITAVNAISDEALTRAQLLLDGKCVPYQSAATSEPGTEGIVHLIADLPDMPTAWKPQPFVRLQLTSGEVRQPSNESRHLGIALGKITLEAVPDADSSPQPERRESDADHGIFWRRGRGDQRAFSRMRYLVRPLWRRLPGGLRRRIGPRLLPILNRGIRWLRKTVNQCRQALDSG